MVFCIYVLSLSVTFLRFAHILRISRGFFPFRSWAVLRRVAVRSVCIHSAPMALRAVSSLAGHAQGSCEHSCSPSMDVLSFLLGKWVGEELLAHMVNVRLVLEESTKPLSQVIVQLYVLTSNKSSSCPSPRQHLLLSDL